MTQPLKKANSPPNTHQSAQDRPSRNDQQNQDISMADVPKSDDIVTKMVKKIDGFTIGLREYKIREMVEDTKQLGEILAVKGEKGLKTNQIRKFLDAINRFKVQQIGKSELSEESQDELHVLRYQLAYAAAKQKKKDSDPVEPLKKVLEVAIKQVKGKELENFNRLVQLIESIVAYHKAAGGKDQ
ncbi:type III-A CRISPR-associated protein Csm2 [Planktothrix agardhii]|jgi:CRISPR-associated protein Csm2|uniref:type III-A CRISPR-associated protein Csm2 n=1 Tax=Planktothrix agardhii TaxID=1160 RepID=UPI001D0A3230|nr:type III-A CRISPR-associated protein Csm2 [Planktothrix agardhii]MCB8762218.1 type III-A CRISPR-associated protein Csm2 [Planktothrix agardhii 1813]